MTLELPIAVASLLIVVVCIMLTALVYQIVQWVREAEAPELQPDVEQMRVMLTPPEPRVAQVQLTRGKDYMVRFRGDRMRHRLQYVSPLDYNPSVPLFIANATAEPYRPVGNQTIMYIEDPEAPRTDAVLFDAYEPR